jgi:phage terminase large subunit-like protein
MTTKKTTRVKAPSLGPWICAWIEQNLVHSEGDFYGKPFRLQKFEKAFIWRAYELNPDGSRKYQRALLGLSKGNGKTELGAALAVCELAGPVVFDDWIESGKPRAKQRLAPDIPVAAASFEQADTLFGSAKTMITQGQLAPLFECFDTEILPKQGPGRLYRVAAVAGTNDGRRPTFFVADELHEWEGKKERVHLVLSNGRAKRADAWELSISTAGWNYESLLGHLHRHGQRIEAREVDDPTFLMQWVEASKDYDLSDPKQLRQAVIEANPAVGAFLPLDNVLQRFSEVPEYEFRRYYLNQWVASPERWLPVGAWENLEAGDEVEEGEHIAIGFDGSYSGDSTAVVGATIEETPHIFIIDAWEKPDGADDKWRVNILDVENTLRQACAKWNVEAVACDPFRWQRSMQVLLEEGLPILEWPSHTPARMVPACAQFQDAVMEERLTQDGDERLAQHVSNCVVKIDSRGPRITKDHKASLKHIDLAVASVIAYDMVVRNADSTYESQGITFI